MTPTPPPSWAGEVPALVGVHVAQSIPPSALSSQTVKPAPGPRVTLTVTPSTVIELAPPVSHEGTPLATTLPPAETPHAPLESFRVIVTDEPSSPSPEHVYVPEQEMHEFAPSPDEGGASVFDGGVS